MLSAQLGKKNVHKCLHMVFNVIEEYCCEFLVSIQNMDRGRWTTPWTPNFLKKIASVNMKSYQRSGYEKHGLLFITHVLD